MTATHKFKYKQEPAPGHPDCKGARYYEDGERDETSWICPYTECLFGDAPKKLYLYLTLES